MKIDIKKFGFHNYLKDIRHVSLMWCPNDKKGFMNSTIGQIHNDNMSVWIEKLCTDQDNKVFLEVGTWNGLGSTKVFVDSLHGRTDIEFYSLECNKEKSEYARDIHRNLSNIHILNEILVNVTVEDICEIFPELNDNAEMRRWNEIDIENSNTCKVFNFNNDFDVVLLDGGEFTTYHEFKRIEDHCKYLLLDDINTNKCKKIVEEIKSQPTKWNILEENTKDRNGFMVCVRS